LSVHAAIRSALALSSVAREFTDLRRRGGRLVGLCPLHSERTPSFTVDDETGRWRCWGCGQHGDVFDLVALMVPSTPGAILRDLAARAGVPLDTLTPSQAAEIRAQAIGRRERRESLRSNERAAWQRLAKAAERLRAKARWASALAVADPAWTAPAGAWWHAATLAEEAMDRWRGE
jgi:DNA primase